MKRFTTLSLLLVFFFFLLSCEKVKEATTIDFETTMSVEIPVEVVDPGISAIVKSAQVSYSFSQSLTESLEDNDNINNYLDHLKSIAINDVDIAFSGLQADQIIENIDISVEGVGVIASIENVSPTNLLHQPEINSSVLIQIANILNNEKEITIVVSGTTNEAPMNFLVDTSFDLHIEASPL